MEYYDKLFRVLVEKGVCPTRAQEININPRFGDLLRGHPREMMTFMCHIIGSGWLLATRRDAGQATLDNLDKPLSNSTSSEHDDEGDNHVFGSTTPSDQGQGVSDPSGGTPPRHSLDDHKPELEDVPHVSPESAY